MANFEVYFSVVFLSWEYKPLIFEYSGYIVSIRSIASMDIMHFKLLAFMLLYTKWHFGNETNIITRLIRNSLKWVLQILFYLHEVLKYYEFKQGGFVLIVTTRTFQCKSVYHWICSNMRNRLVYSKVELFLKSLPFSNYLPPPFIFLDSLLS